MSEPEGIRRRKAKQRTERLEGSAAGTAADAGAEMETPDQQVIGLERKSELMAPVEQSA